MARQHAHDTSGPRGVDQLTVQSWWRDLLRATQCAVGIALLCTLFLLLASTDLLEVKGSPNESIAADASWAGILAGCCGVMWAFVQISGHRPDNGYRDTGLTALLALGVMAATVIDLVVMSAWPWIVGDRAAPTEVIATLVTDPLSFGIVAGYLIAMHAGAAACVIGLVRGGWQSSIVVGGFLLVVLLVGIWHGARLFASTPSLLSLAAWLMLAVLALGVLTVTSELSGPRDEAPGLGR